MTRTAIICGGSIGGLFAAAALIRDGWHVDVFERTDVPLAGRGAGIVTHAELIAGLRAVGASTLSLGVEATERVAYDIAGRRVAAFDFAQVVTSWDRMYQVLRALVPDARYHYGRTATGYTDQGTRVEVRFSDGTTHAADLLVGADGFRSAIRARMLPQIQPEYSGYLVWRALANESDLPADIRADIFNTFGFFAPDSAQIIGYPIAGPGNDLRPGHRRYNFVWYGRADRAALADLLTDGSGQRHEVSIPPPLIRDDVIAAMFARAEATLPPPFTTILKRGERPFFTPIYDHHSPVMGRGRVALAGDAACVARPHVGMGVTKAAHDALALARELAKADVPEALAAYSAARTGPCRIAFETSRHLGRLIFDPAPGSNPDGRGHPDLHELMHRTAVVPEALADATASACPQIRTTLR